MIPGPSWPSRYVTASLPTQATLATLCILCSLWNINLKILFEKEARICKTCATARVTGVRLCLYTQPETLTKIKQTEKEKEVKAYKNYVHCVIYHNRVFACMSPSAKDNVGLTVRNFWDSKKRRQLECWLSDSQRGFIFSFFRLAVCIGLLSWRAHVQDPAQDGAIKTCSGEGREKENRN